MESQERSGREPLREADVQRLKYFRKLWPLFEWLFTLFSEIHVPGSSYVCRIRDNRRYDVLEERPLSEAARSAAGFRHAEARILSLQVE
jgi:hypothetical protein